MVDLSVQLGALTLQNPVMHMFMSERHSLGAGLAALRKESLRRGKKWEEKILKSDGMAGEARGR